MSRSHKYTPIHGNTRAETEKDDKRIARKALRRAVNAWASVCGDESVLPMPVPSDVGDRWAWDKDGKNWFDPARHPKLMRK